MPWDLLGELRDRFDWLGEFDVQIWSCELGIVKPDARIYRVCLEALQCDPGRAVFFDDRLRNVEAARELGIDAHLFESVEQARAVVCPTTCCMNRR
jgi:putative hydrolase of the HAD superfamily